MYDKDQTQKLQLQTTEWLQETKNLNPKSITNENVEELKQKSSTN